MPGGELGILNHYGIVTSSSYTPTAGQWTTQTITLPAGANMVKFTAISDFGNNLYVDNIGVEESPSHDIGIVSYAYGSRPEMKTFSGEGLDRKLSSQDEESKSGNKSDKNQNISISYKVPKNSHFTDSAPANFTVIVQNFGQLENSYMVGWEIDGVVQTSVNNTDPLEVADTDTLILTWASPTGGVHTTRAWTILAGDTNPNNDSSATTNFYVVPSNVVWGEYFETTLPPAGWLSSK